MSVLFFEKEFSSNVSSSPKNIGYFKGLALKRYKEIGLPTSKNENWKYTNVKSLLKKPWTVEAESQPDSEIPLESENQLIFSNGLFIINKSTWDKNSIEVLQVSSDEITSEQRERIESTISTLEDGFAALTVGLGDDFFMIRVLPEARLKSPLVIRHLFSGIQSQENRYSASTIFLEVGRGSEVDVVEQVYGNDSFAIWSNTFLDISISQNARISLARLQSLSSESQYIGGVRIQQDRDSYANCVTFTQGGSVLRNSVVMEQRGDAATSECHGLYLCQGNEHTDHRVTIRHMKPHGVSRQLFKGVLKDYSRAVFNGKIFIAEGAQKVDSEQLNNNLLLSPRAEADSKPELEVYADDVKANHGSAIGQIDKDQLFYLMTRGIPKNEAIRILAKGFIEDVELKINSKALKPFVRVWIESGMAIFQESLETSRGFLGE